MPGSLLLPTNTYSDFSEISVRSLDSKISPKKVSFNNAVRVKQYPWKPDVESENGEHLTLPSNRFWFKVYKSKQDALLAHSAAAGRKNAWEEDTVESIHDSLAPIAEDEDTDIQTNHFGSSVEYPARNLPSAHYPSTSKNISKPVEPPIDYFDDLHLDSNLSRSNLDSSWKNRGVHLNPNDLKNGHSKYQTALDLRYDPLLERDECLPDGRFGSSTPRDRGGPPWGSFQAHGPLRGSVRRPPDPEGLKKRERRSRSHDDHLENGGRFKLLKKADKSVSTEDLNEPPLENGFISNRFLKGSRDMSTQCYGTLTRSRVSDFGTLSSPSRVLQSEAERLNNFKSQSSSRLTATKESYAPMKSITNGKDALQSEIVNRPRPYQGYRALNPSDSTDAKVNFKNYDPYYDRKITSGVTKDVIRGENYCPNSTQYGKKKQSLRSSEQPFSSIHNGGKIAKDKPDGTNRDSATVGYLRGRQIPLKEVNPNINRRYMSGSEIGTSRNSFSYRSKANDYGVVSPKLQAKSEAQIPNGLRSKRYPAPNLENNGVKNFRTDYGSSKFSSPSKKDCDSSMIDWSLSGFHLTKKQDNGRASISDSEYTVHKREPLLMYIPGISHHEHPAVEDDRLSALSDVSRSELSLNSFGKTSPSDILRRSMPRDGRHKWMKWTQGRN